MPFLRFPKVPPRLFAVALASMSFLLVVIASPVTAHTAAALWPAPAAKTAVALDPGEAFDASSLIEQGKTLFAAGRLAEAAQIWQQAQQHYQTQGNGLEQARSLHYLALAYLNLGQWEAATSANANSLSLLQGLSPATETVRSLLAAGFNTQGNLQLALGQPEAALATWQQTEDLHKNLGDTTGQLGSQINQAKALQALGYYRRSQTLLERALDSLQAEADQTIKATGLRLLGIALHSVGNLAQAQTLLEQSLSLTQQLAATQPVFTHQVSPTLLSLGNTLRALQASDAALERYQQAAALAPSALFRVEALLNQLSLQLEMDQSAAAEALLPQIQADLATLPPSREAVYAEVNFAANLMALSAATNRRRQSPDLTAELLSPRQIAQRLVAAITAAKTLQDLRAETYALEQLGHLYESLGQWPDAKTATQQAITLAESMKATDIAAPAQWQLGRILHQQGQTAAAIAAYSRAVEHLQALRQELVALNPDLQFSFKENVEPVYRELVALLLTSHPSQTNLQQARELIEALQLAEINNFFRQACLKASPRAIDTVDPEAAVIYPIILPDRLAVVVSRPGQPLFHFETQLPQADVEQVIGELQLYLNPHFFEQDRLRLSQQLYDWLIRPAEAALAESQIQTLVFVLDGSLRNLPMAALYDGDQYLIERYSIALSPGLQLLEPRSLNTQRLKALTAGLSQSQQGFSALPAVEVELDQVADTLPATQLLNQRFTTQQLRQSLNDFPFPIVHLATHGQFSSAAEETFLVTWDGRINVTALDELLQPRVQNPNQPLELLVLSACQTAAGDSRAALGLAGMALRSGARSTLATLWQVNDASTAKLMGEFYRQLTQHPENTKAEALRLAQLTLLHEEDMTHHPFYWAPFVLIGNWL
ncbi:CHAT domain-containing protein [Almyronema epifaneia]|uniref:CHAT domain-containing protein n=1 Tax=Almyronema epifaneia S1 TaxID=2991925 RepID=A0ABW6IE47_9CYAN